MTALTPCARLDCGNVLDCPACSPNGQATVVSNYLPNTGLGLCADNDPMFAEVGPAQQQPSPWCHCLTPDHRPPTAEPEIGEISGCIPEPPHQTVLVLREQPQFVPPGLVCENCQKPTRSLATIRKGGQFIKVCPMCSPAGLREDDDPMFVEIEPDQPELFVLHAEIARLAAELAGAKADGARLAADNGRLGDALIAERRAHDAVRDVLARHITTNAARSHTSHSTAVGSGTAAFTAPAGGYDCGGPRCGHQPCICDPEPADHPALPASAITRTRQRIGLLVP